MTTTTVKERPILFTGPMVRAILDGRKSQTRRVVKPQPFPSEHNQGEWLRFAGRRGGSLIFSINRRRKEVTDTRTGKTEVADYHVPVAEWLMSDCPYGVPGDRLWVRETWGRFAPWQGYFYAADDHSFGIGEGDDPDHIEPEDIRWRPSIHMPRVASRLTLAITGVRVERLQEISHEDAIAEGCSGKGWKTSDSREPVVYPAIEYADLWNRINGPGSWDANPWVWVISFRRLETSNHGR